MQQYIIKDSNETYNSARLGNPCNNWIQAGPICMGVTLCGTTHISEITYNKPIEKASKFPVLPCRFSDVSVTALWYFWVTSRFGMICVKQSHTYRTCVNRGLPVCLSFGYVWFGFKFLCVASGKIKWQHYHYHHHNPVSNFSLLKSNILSDETCLKYVTNACFFPILLEIEEQI